MSMSKSPEPVNIFEMWQKGIKVEMDLRLLINWSANKELIMDFQGGPM